MATDNLIKYIVYLDAINVAVVEADDVVDEGDILKFKKDSKVVGKFVWSNIFGYVITYS